LEDWDLEKSSTLDLLTSVYNNKPGLISQNLEAVAAADTVAQQLRVEEGFPLIMLSRIIFSSDTKTPVVFSQDFLRSDYTRLHTDVELETSPDQERGNELGKEAAETSQER
jgi:DNA-binding GntR family transcriptional regulator